MLEPNKPKMKKMLAPGQYIDEQLPETWSDKDLAGLKKGSSTLEKSEERNSSREEPQGRSESKGR